MIKLSKSVDIINKRGLHARASAKFANLVDIIEEREVRVTVTKDSQEVAGNSIMGLMMLGASFGTYVQITVQAQDQAQAEKALFQLVTLIENKFDEKE